MRLKHLAGTLLGIRKGPIGVGPFQSAGGESPPQAKSSPDLVFIAVALLPDQQVRQNEQARGSTPCPVPGQEQA